MSRYNQSHDPEKMACLAATAQMQQGAGSVLGGQNKIGAPTLTDPASARAQYQAIVGLCDRLNSHRNRLREIADVVLGPEPEEPSNAQGGIAGASVGGVTGDIVAAYQSAGWLLNDIERQIDRLQRVAS